MKQCKLEPGMSTRRTALLLLFALLGGGCSLFHPKPGPRPLYKKLSPSISYEMMRDSPLPQEFNGPTGHVHDAKNIPVARLPYRLLDILLYRDDTVFIYCDSDECTEQGAKVLAASGFESVVGMAGGINDWIRSGFKTVLPASIAERRGEAEKAPIVMPEKPGEKKNDPNREVPVKPPAPPPPAPPPPRE